MHFAAKLIVNESVSMPLDYYYNNVYGVISLIQSMRRANIKTLIFSSTAAAYGDHPTGFCEENDICLPINPYGNSKLAAEMVIKDSAKAYGLNTCIFRYFNAQCWVCPDHTYHERHHPALCLHSTSRRRHWRSVWRLAQRAFTTKVRQDVSC